jgi:hypothetical protein
LKDTSSGQYSIMSEERIGEKFVRKLYEKTVNNEIENINNDEIEKEIVI